MILISIDSNAPMRPCATAFSTGKKQGKAIGDWANDRAAEGVVVGGAKGACGVVRLCKAAGKLAEKTYDKVKDSVGSAKAKAKDKVSASLTREKGPKAGSSQKAKSSDSVGAQRVKGSKVEQSKYDDATDKSIARNKAKREKRRNGNFDDRKQQRKNANEDVTKKADFTVTPDGVAIPMNPNTLNENLKQLDFQSTSKATSKKYVSEDSLGPMRVRIEKAHPSDPNFTGTPDPLHTVDHLHIDRRKNVTTGGFKSKEKIQYDWPF